MEVRMEKSKIMVISTRNTAAQISMNEQQLEVVDTFKYLGATLTKNVRSTTSAMSKLSRIFKSKEISLPTKLKLFKFLVVSILLYGCERWTMTKESTRRIQTFESKSFRRLSWAFPGQIGRQTSSSTTRSPF